MNREFIDLFELDFFQLRFLEKLNNLFHYKSDSVVIPHNLEYYFRLYGSVGYYLEGKKFVCGYVNEGSRDENGEPTIYNAWDLSTNKRSYTLKIGEEVIVGYNNALHFSDRAIIDYYCNLLKEIDVSIKYQIINSRLVPILAVSDDRLKKEAEKMFESIQAGKPFVICTDLMEDLKTLDIIDNQNIDKMQYLTSTHEAISKRLYNEFGIDAESIDKRAQVNSNELAGQKDVTCLNFLSYVEERYAFCERMRNAGIEIECIPSPIYATEPNEEEIEDPEAARELMQEMADPEPEPEPAPEEPEEKKEGEDDGKEDN